MKKNTEISLEPYKDLIVTYGRHPAFLSPQAQVTSYQRGDKIIDSNYDITHLYLILEGKAKICLIHENGKSSIIDFIQTGDFIGELTLLEAENTHKDVIAVTDCLCVRIPFSLAGYNLTHNSEFLLHLCRYLGKKSLRRSLFHAKSQSYELKHRLAAHILNLENDGIYHEKHTETAEYLGVSYRHLLYTMEQLRESGILISEKKGYRVDRAALQELATGILE